MFNMLNLVEEASPVRKLDINEEEKGNKNINLEDAIEIEKHLTKILDVLRKETDPTIEWEDWWVITDPSSYTLNKLSSFF